MKLTTKVSIQKIRVIADYQRKENSPMFASILKYAYNNNNTITINKAKNSLTGSTLNTRMWQNILDRMIAQEYFEKRTKQIEDDSYEIWREDYYELTDFGREVAKQNAFFKSMKGELEIWIIKDKIDWLPFQIVSIQEKGYSHQKVKNSKNVRDFNLPKLKILNLKNASFRLKHLEGKCAILGTESIDLTITALKKYGNVNIKDLTFTKSEFSKKQLQNDFLSMKYKHDYQKQKQIVRTVFDNNIQFQRSVPIPNPTIGQVTFNEISLDNINFMAKTEAHAEAWRLAWMKVNLIDYIFENAEFEKLAYQIWKIFEPNFKLSLLTISDFEQFLKQDKVPNFHHLMKLQAPQLLTY